ncbi:Rap1a/Tai family immunity protein [Phyllobacterium myrsinacearum]|uniref:Rap1a immunity protein domain-containing protein n=1 Tax=Phyllobacterium myrsinacearum TaxID=28101 RepID=A0A839EM92_9HYPH|nr:hypothetical protein [Phyllobacterium myrsinacearum]
MRIWRIALFAIACAASVNSAHAGFYNGNDLYNVCKDNTKDEYILCLGYTQGSADSFDVIRLLSKKEPCLLSPISGEQVADVVTKYLKNNPDKRHEPGGFLVNKALTEAFCSKP